MKNRAIFGNMPELPYAVEEAVNRLRININFVGNDVKKILFVSSEPNEGKSFVATQLWKQMAQMGTPSILVDADLRNSVMVEKYEISREDGQDVLGLSQYLAGKEELDRAILHTEIEGGDILPNVENVMNPSFLIEGERFEHMLDTLTERYRYVFLDVPPLGMVSDAERIANLCDGAVLCIRSAVATKAEVRDSVELLQRTGCPLLGVVLNRVESSKGGYYHSKYGHYGKYGYGYGYGYGHENQKKDQ